MDKTKTFTIALAAALMTGCVSDGTGGITWEHLAGCAVGGATGGFAGSKIGDGDGQVAASAGGAILGCLGGAYVAEQFTDKDASAAQAALNESMRSRGPAVWKGDSGITGTFKPQSGRYMLAGRPDPNTGAIPRFLCQDYTHEIIAEGGTKTEAGMACRGDDGTWRAS